MNINIDKKYDSSVREDNYSRILYGVNDTAVILLHGFISSPFEVYFLGEKINHNGFTVFMPLIDGFGGSTALANQTKYEQWQSTLTKSIDLLNPCYSKIIIIGFSLGGTIVSDFLINDLPKYQEVIGAILLAPYYEQKMFGGEFINTFFDIFSDSISLKTLYKISGNEDLKIPISNPDHYNSDMPIKALKEIIKFRKNIRCQEYIKKVNIPILFIYTEDDQTVSNLASIKFTRKHFDHLTVLKFNQNKKIRHQFSLPAGNPEFDIFCNSIIDFIEELNGL